jgi:hypothetical protein
VEVGVRHKEREFYYHTSTSSHPRIIRTTLRYPEKNPIHPGNVPHTRFQELATVSPLSDTTRTRMSQEKRSSSQQLFPPLKSSTFSPESAGHCVLRCRDRTVAAATSIEPKPRRMTCRFLGIRNRKFRARGRRAGAEVVRPGAMFMKSGSQSIHMKIRKRTIMSRVSTTSFHLFRSFPFIADHALDSRDPPSGIEADIH